MEGEDPLAAIPEEALDLLSPVSLSAALDKQQQPREDPLPWFAGVLC
jgi:hypothetical protein